MTLFIVSLVLVIAVGVGYLVRVSARPGLVATTEPPPTEEELLQARLDLLRVELDVSASLANLEHHLAAERVKESIAEALQDGR